MSDVCRPLTKIVMVKMSEFSGTLIRVNSSQTAVVNTSVLAKGLPGDGYSFWE
jgi:hypothetical protein